MHRHGHNSRNSPFSVIKLVYGSFVLKRVRAKSQRTQVSLGTVRALVVAWAPPEGSRDHLDSVLKEVIDLSGEFCGGVVAEWGILS